jgi:hypothetical protein
MPTTDSQFPTQSISMQAHSMKTRVVELVLMAVAVGCIGLAAYAILALFG